MNTDRALALLGFESVDLLQIQELKKRYRARAKQKHPDKQGGSRDAFVELQTAYQHLKKILESAEDELAKIRKAIIEEHMELEEAELERRLRIIDKSELLNKLIESEKRLVVHEAILKKQSEFLSETRDFVEEIVDEYKEKQSSLRIELTTILDQLEVEYKPNVVQKVMFFLPRPNYNEFLERKEGLMSQFHTLSVDLENQLSKEIVKIYGEALNHLTNTIEELEYSYEA
jgi:curved DNA-binding protein CbpA